MYISLRKEKEKKQIPPRKNKRNNPLTHRLVNPHNISGRSPAKVVRDRAKIRSEVDGAILGWAARQYTKNK